MKLHEKAPVSDTWSRVRLNSFLAFFTILLSFTVVFFTLAPRLREKHGNGIVCNPDGQVRFRWYDEVIGYHVDGYLPGPGRLLWIDLGFGAFSYSQAKTLDTTWDLLVGRGGQALIAISIYSTVRRTLLYEMEIRPQVQLSLYVALAFKDFTFSNLSLLYRHRHWFIVGYIVIFPTLVSVMTGYQVRTAPYVRRPDNGYLMDAHSLYNPPMVVVDGSRVGLANMTSINASNPIYEILHSYHTSWRELDSKMFISPASASGWRFDARIGCEEPVTEDCVASPDEWTTCLFRLYMADYEIASCVNMSDAAESMFQYHSDITLLNQSWELRGEQLQISLRSENHEYGSIISNNYWLATGDMEPAISEAYLETKGATACQPLDSYKWGFASPMLIIFCVLTMIFTLLLFFMSWIVYVNSTSDRCEQPISIYRDILDVAQEIRSLIGSDYNELSTTELHKKCEDQQINILLETDGLPCSRSERALRARRREERSNEQDSAIPMLETGAGQAQHKGGSTED